MTTKSSGKQKPTARAQPYLRKQPTDEVLRQFYSTISTKSEAVQREAKLLLEKLLKYTSDTAVRLRMIPQLTAELDRPGLESGVVAIHVLGSVDFDEGARPLWLSGNLGLSNTKALDTVRDRVNHWKAKAAEFAKDKRRRIVFACDEGAPGGLFPVLLASDTEFSEESWALVEEARAEVRKLYTNRTDYRVYWWNDGTREEKDDLTPVIQSDTWNSAKLEGKATANSLSSFVSQVTEMLARRKPKDAKK